MSGSTRLTKDADQLRPVPIQNNQQNPNGSSSTVTAAGEKSHNGKILAGFLGASLGAIVSTAIFLSVPQVLVYVTALLNIPFVTPAVIAVAIAATTVLAGLIGLAIRAVIDSCSGTPKSSDLFNSIMPNEKNGAMQEMQSEKRQREELKRQREELNEKLREAKRIFNEQKERIQRLSESNAPDDIRKNMCKGAKKTLEEVKKILKELRSHHGKR